MGILNSPYTNVPLRRWCVACLLAPLIAPTLIFCIDLFWLPDTKNVFEIVMGLPFNLVFFGIPTYAGMILFGVPVLYFFRKMQITSWFVYAGGGVLCALCWAMAFEVFSQGAIRWWAVRGTAHYIVGMGVVDGVGFRALLLGFGRK